MKPNPALTKAFLALSDKKLGNLAWHVKNKTPICCGETASLYTDGGGGG